MRSAAVLRRTASAARGALPLYAAALWWGSLTALGFVFVPALFVAMDSTTLAGRTAARLFTAQAWLSIVCGIVLLAIFKRNPKIAQEKRASVAMISIATGLLCAILVEFAIAPRILRREDLALWHGVATTLFAMQWICAGGALWFAACRSSASQNGARAD